jgi:hypothetical protein
MPEMKEGGYTKISISKDLHEIIKDICVELGVKMYHFEDEAIKSYIRSKYPSYANKIDEK